MNIKTATTFLPEEDSSLKDLKEALLQSLLEGDEEAFKDCMFTVTRVLDYEDIIKGTELSKKNCLISPEVIEILT